MRTFKIIITFLILAIATWFLCDGILWLTFMMKPYTHVGKMIEIIVSHIVFLVISCWFSFQLNNDKSDYADNIRHSPHIKEDNRGE